MEGDKKVIEHLNILLQGELTAINQYFLHSRMLEDWGVTKLAKHEYDESIEEMQHADVLIKRIITLGGLPNVQDIGKIFIGENVREVIECDLKIERKGIANYKAAIKHAESVDDYVTSQMLRELLKDEEGHQDHQETQLQLIDTIGLERFIQLNATPEE